MAYALCILGGIVLGLIGGFLVCRKLSGDHTGESVPISPEQYERIKAILEHIQAGDDLIQEIDELLGK